MAIGCSSEKYGTTSICRHGIPCTEPRGQGQRNDAKESNDVDTDPNLLFGADRNGELQLGRVAALVAPL